ncbi:DUF4160 domain-containing protein [Zavarzinia aquatilis]|uniref:DUF4160 domain-containing protein n=1 Tax=Zavarzinia aquatilis TaxID=2211142 RepID=A0A317EGN5_9PROT|nr:DUF4160 domain-containing protein [Zavarzinia aquatilis]PWR24375.1 DUF4160 domain-containing protein [Zavarzinia aquatilis]
MFADDHHPPHFHVVTPDHEVLVRLADFEVIAGQIDRRNLDMALAWAGANRERLDHEWKRLNAR